MKLGGRQVTFNRKAGLLANGRQSIKMPISLRAQAAKIGVVLFHKWKIGKILSLAYLL